jgi:hypothetical protein
VTRPRISFGKIAHRVGAVTMEQLETARTQRDDSGGNLEEILLKMEALTPELAEFVRDAFVRACAVCERCGRRTDVEDRNAGDHACRCGGTFVSLAETMEEGDDVPAELLESEIGPVSDVATLDVGEDAP